MADTQLQTPGVMNLPIKAKTIFSVLMFVGFVTFIVMLMNNPERAWHAYLTAFFYFVTLSLGGLFFTAIHHMTSAGWSVNVRRFSEAMTTFLPVAFIGAIALLVAGDYLYSWLNPEIVAQDHLLQHKEPYLNRGFFWIRTILFFGIWLLFAKILVGRSLKVDETGDDNTTLSLMRPSVIFILLFALTYSLFSVDTLMALEPHWFSTIFGVYCFGGMFQSTMAFMILTILYFMKNGQLKGYVDENHLHDLGKYMFAFTVFWAYIAFSQYMLIWYANLPEETIFFMPRSHGSWMWVSIGLLVGKFVIPFFALLPRWAKRTPVHLAAVSIWILIMQYVDLYWLVYPNLNHDEVIFSFSEVLIFLGFAGAFLFTTTRFLSKHQIVPTKDGRVQESMHHHVVY
jgi:hypothetical protein